jgi:rhodanese-related sulfurtransferase
MQTPMKSLRRMRVAFVLAIVLLGGCGLSPSVGVVSDVAVSAQNEALPANVSSKHVAELYRQGEVVIVDVRQAWEYEDVHVEDSILIPLDELSERTDEVPTDQPVILLCRSGNRSGQALRLLENAGFDNVHNLVGGITAWEQQGYPVER